MVQALPLYFELAVPLFFNLYAAAVSFWVTTPYASEKRSFSKTFWGALGIHPVCVVQKLA